MDHDAVSALLGAYAVDACEPEEAIAVQAHLAGCERCAAEATLLVGAAGALGTLEMAPPPDGLRRAVLSAARALDPGLPGPVAAYAEQADRLDALLAGLAPEAWTAHAVDEWSIQDLVAHLGATEGLVGETLGAGPAAEPGDVFARTAAAVERNRGREPGETLAEWRDRVGAVRQALSGTDEEDLDRRVEWLGVPVPMRRVLVGRAFETWVHADDVRRAVGRPPRPPRSEHMHLIADLAVRSLPAALRTLGVEGAGRTARVVLTGDGGGEWTLALGRGQEPGEPDAVLVADVVDFCLLAGGRLSPQDLIHEARGDRGLVAHLLQAAPAFAGP